MSTSELRRDVAARAYAVVTMLVMLTLESNVNLQCGYLTFFAFDRELLVGSFARHSASVLLTQ